MEGGGEAGGKMNSIRLFAVAGLLACSASSADFFPLETGNTWTYKEAKTGQPFTVRVGLPSLINQRAYYSLSGYVDSRPWCAWTNAINWSTSMRSRGASFR